MIIFGVRTPHIGTAEPENNFACHHCGQENTLVLPVYSTHFHIFWIPMFPVNKKVYSYCTHCKAQLERHEMSDQLRIEANNAKDQVKRPWWQFFGLIGVGLMFAFMIFSAIIGMIAAAFA